MDRIFTIFFIIFFLMVVMVNGGDEPWICDLKYLNPGSNLTFPTACVYPTGCSQCTTATGIVLSNGRITSMFVIL
jgi:hypothetical protein